MSHDLEHFEREVKNSYGNYKTFSPSIKLQPLANYIGLGLSTWHNLLAGPVLVGPKEIFLPNHSSFHNTVEQMSIFPSDNNLYLYCKKKAEFLSLYSPIYVIGFPASMEPKIFEILKRTERLRSFS